MKKITALLLSFTMAIAMFGLFPKVQVKALDCPVTVDTVNKVIYANGKSLLIQDGDIPGTTKIHYDGYEMTYYCDVVGAINVDLSDYTIYGGCKSSSRIVSSGIWMRGGKVKSIYGGGKESGAIIKPYLVGTRPDELIIDGGIVTGNIYGGGKESGATINTEMNSNYPAGVIIRGGKVYGDVYGGGEYADIEGDTLVKISGGNVYGNVYAGCQYGNVTGSKAIRITGGTIPNNLSQMPQYDYQTPCYKTEIKLDGINTAKIISSCSLGNSYGINDVLTDTDGKLYFYLPVNTTTTYVTANWQKYIGTVTTNSDNSSAATFYLSHHVTVNNGTGTDDYILGDTVNITATVPTGKKFVNWTTSDSVTFANENIASTSFLMPNSPVTVKANFEDIPVYTLTVDNGIVSGQYPEGEVVNISADTPPEGQQFKNWTTSDGGTIVNANSATTTYIMPANDATVTANYEDIPVYTLTVDNGTGSGNYKEGEVVNITANAAIEGHRFKNWTTSEGGTIGNVNGSTTTYTMPANDATITANYEAIVTSTPTPAPSGNNSVSTTDNTPLITSTDKVMDLVNKSQENDTIKVYGNDDVRISKDILTKLKDNKSKLCISNSWYTWYIDGKTVKNPADINLTCTKEEDKKTGDITAFKIAHNGKLPFNSKLKVELPGYIKEGTEVYLYNIMDGKRTFEGSGETIEYSVIFDMKSSNQYVISTEKYDEISAGEGRYENVTPLQVAKNGIPFLILSIGLVTVIIVYKRKVKR